jgi:uncharacterized cupin superfamily protein
VRHPGGEDELAQGDVVCFPAGPEGAHKVTNRGNETVRVLMVSTRRLPAVVVYPDSNKLGAFTDVEGEDVMVRRSDSVGYWEDEPLGEDTAPPDP